MAAYLSCSETTSASSVRLLIHSASTAVTPGLPGFEWLSSDSASIASNKALRASDSFGAGNETLLTHAEPFNPESWRLCLCRTDSVEFEERRQFASRIFCEISIIFSTTGEDMFFGV